MVFENWENLKDYIESNSVEVLTNNITNNYDYETYYKKYKKYRFKEIFKNIKIKDLIWQGFLVRFNFFNLLFKNKKLPEGYFGSRPFEYGFKNYPPAAYSNDFSNKPPTWEEGVVEIKENINNYSKMYSELEDELSKKTLLTLISARLTRDPSLFIKNEVYINDKLPCFDTSVIKNLDKDAVYVDCGGFDGDTVKLFINTYKNYTRIYVYEPDKLLFDRISKNLESYKNIYIIPFGVSDSAKDIGFNFTGGGGSMIEESANESNLIKVVSLDENVKEKVSFIKMDIEGHEPYALRGAKNHIMEDNPILAINVYHKVHDLIECFNIIKSLNPNYDFYLRHYNRSFIKTVLYAVPI